MEEIWKDVEGWEGEYKISNFGRILSKKRNKGWVELKGSIDTGGYNYLCLYSKKEKRVQKWMHRLVAIYFIPNPNNHHDVNHKDGNKLNNRVDNLEWVNRRENVAHANKLRGDKKLPSGVVYRKDTKKYKAQYWLNNKTYIIGNFFTPEEAHKAYLKKLKEIGSSNRYSRF